MPRPITGRANQPVWFNRQHKLHMQLRRTAPPIPSFAAFAIAIDYLPGWTYLVSIFLPNNSLTSTAMLVVERFDELRTVATTTQHRRISSLPSLARCSSRRSNDPAKQHKRTNVDVSRPLAAGFCQRPSDGSN